MDGGLTCRLGLHRWQKLRRPDGSWYRHCRACGAEREVGGGGLGIAISFLLGLAATVAGVVLALTLHSLIGPILVLGGVLGLGRVAFVVGLGRVAVFLSTGTWRREG